MWYLSELMSFWALPSSGIIKNITLQTLDLLPSSGENLETPTLLCPLEIANLNNRTSGDVDYHCWFR
jgi:hypothetical protein